MGDPVANSTTRSTAMGVLGKITTLLTGSALMWLARHAPVVAAHTEAATQNAAPHALAARRLFAANAQRSLAACQNAPYVRRLEQQVHARRRSKIQELQDQVTRRHRRLAASDVLATSHKSTLSPSDVEAAILFGWSPKCVLQPDVTHGPYYVSGERIRSDLRETQRGIDLYTEIQIIDTNSCKPVENMYVDLWHCNASGVYSGVVASGNGDSSDQSNLNRTFLRGVFPTDAHGLVQFVTKFPGRYAGRAPHLHVMGNYDGHVLANQTYTGSSVAHIGQLFFDQELLTAVDASALYATNQVAVTTNAHDEIFAQAAANGFDPVLKYLYLGKTVDDGIFSWISIGVDMNATKAVVAAATWTANGGVASPSAAAAGGVRGGVPQGPGPMNGTGGGHGHAHDDDTRSALFSLTFFVVSAAALGALLYYWRVKKNKPSEKYATMDVE